MLRLQALSSAVVAAMLFMLLFAAKVAWCTYRECAAVCQCLLDVAYNQKSFNLNITGAEWVELEYHRSGRSGA